MSGSNAQVLISKYIPCDGMDGYYWVGLLYEGSSATITRKSYRLPSQLHVRNEHGFEGHLHYFGRSVEISNDISFSGAIVQCITVLISAR